MCNFPDPVSFGIRKEQKNKGIQTLKKYLTITCLLIFFSYPCKAQTPPLMWLFLVDGSVDDNTFYKLNSAVSYQINSIHKNTPFPNNTDMVGVAWYGGVNDYEITPFYECSYLPGIELLKNIARYKTNPWYNGSAIYSALGYSAIAMHNEAIKYSYQYFKIIIALTDESDNDSPDEIKRSIHTQFPNDEFVVIVIGAGKYTDISEFNTIGGTINIENFHILVLVLDQLREKLEEAMQ